MQRFNFGVYVLAVWLAACGGSPSTGPQEPVEPAAGEGVVQLPLVSTSTDGQRYRLVGASFEITGPRSVTLTDTAADTLSVALTAGTYSIRLTGDWSMERVGPPAQQVAATLISPNPLSFTVIEGQTRTVRFLFKMPGDGNADVGFTVDSGGWVSGTFTFDTLQNSGSLPNPFTSLQGQSVPFVISYETVTLTREQGPENTLLVRTGPVTVQFGGAYSEVLTGRVAASLQGAPLEFRLRAQGGQVTFGGFRLMAIRGEPFELELPPSAPFAGALDADGYPAPQPFEYSSGGWATGAVRRGSPFDGQVGISGPVAGTISPR